MASSPKRLWLAVVPAMVVPFLGALIYFVFFSENVIARYCYGLIKFFTLLWPIAAYWFILREKLPRPNLDKRVILRSLPLGAAIGLLIVMAMFLLMMTPIGAMVEGSAGSIRKKTADLGILDHYWFFGFFIAIAHSLLEEYFWRWFVFGQLTRLIRPFAAHALAGLAFAGHHIIVTTQYFPFWWGLILGLAVGIGGIFWSLLYQRQNTLAGAWLSHAIVDFGILAIGHALLF